MKRDQTKYPYAWTKRELTDSSVDSPAEFTDTSKTRVLDKWLVRGVALTLLIASLVVLFRGLGSNKIEPEVWLMLALCWLCVFALFDGANNDNRHEF